MNGRVHMAEDTLKSQLENAPQSIQAIPKEARPEDDDKLKLGATVVKDNAGKVLGVNFAVYTHPEATAAWVSLFDEKGKETSYKLSEYRKSGKFMDNVTPCDGIIWHGFIPAKDAGQRYGFRVDGPFDPAHGKTFHPQRLLIDPYAKEVDGYPEKVMTDTPYLNGARNTSLLNYDVNVACSLKTPVFLDNYDASGLLDWRSKHPINHLPNDFNSYSKEQLLGWCQNIREEEKTKNTQAGKEDHGEGSISQKLIDHWANSDAMTSDIIRHHLYHHPFRQPVPPKVDHGNRDDVYWNALQNPLGKWGYDVTKFRVPDHDTAPNVPKGVVIDEEEVRKNVAARLGWDSHAPEKFIGKPLFPHRDSVILETHIGEATVAFDKIPEKYRGTYKGLASDEFINWVKGQGYTAVELMPVHVDDADTHWGYMTTNFFSPNPKYASKDPKDGTVTEQFAEMTQKLRAHGIETWMDVVYNHTAEGNERGQVHSLKGLDERYYRKGKDDGGYTGEYYYDVTGCGNTCNTEHPEFLEMMMKSLEHFHNLGVSGFRFDLMKALGVNGMRGNTHDHNHRFYTELHDAIKPGGPLEGVKISGEPWYCASSKDGDHPGLPGWIGAWDGGDRQKLRKSWRLPDGIDAKTIASIVAGIGDNIKLAVVHDGLTAWDALSRGHSNGDEDIALHCNGHEDERFRRMTFGIALEAISQGAVLRKMGSDRGHSHEGDHDAYKNELVSRIPWGDRLTPVQSKIMDFSGEAMRFKNAHPSLRRIHQFKGQDHHYKILSEHGDASITWVNAHGHGEPDWVNPHEQAVTLVLSGETGRMENGKPVRDTPVMAMINGSAHEVRMKIPGQSHIEGQAVSWKMAFDSSGRHDKNTREALAYRPGQEIVLPPFTAIAFEANEFPGKERVNAKPVTRFMDAVVKARTETPAASQPSATSR